MKTEKIYIIPENIVMGLLQYLETKPYNEVAVGIQALNTLDELPEPEKKEVE